MKFAHTLMTVCAAIALTACATSTPTAPVASAQPVFQARVTQFPNAQVNEAASAYVSHYKQTIEQSLQSGKYQHELAFKYLSAESCFNSRAYRLLDRELSASDKAGLLKAYVSQEQLQAYEKLARGHFVRVNGLETFSCEVAGLAVDRTNVRY